MAVKGIGVKLLEAKAAVDVQDQIQRTALIWAAGNGREGVCVKLLEAKAAVGFQDKGNKTALHYATERGFRVQVLQLFRGN